MSMLRDRRVQFLRAEMIDDGMATRPGDYMAHGRAMWAARADVSDGEKAQAGTVYAEVSARFVVQSTPFSRGITPNDRLRSGGREFAILGVKEIGFQDRIEITATARTDT